MAKTPQQVKDTVSKMEADWLRRVTGEAKSADVEKAVSRGLARLEARKRNRKPAPVKKPPEKQPDDRSSMVTAQAAADGFKLVRRALPSTNAKPVIAKPAQSSCGPCGRCRKCKREWRMKQILRRAMEGDIHAQKLAEDLARVSLSAQSRLREFTGKRGADLSRILTRLVEDICDRSDVVFKVAWWVK